VPRLPRRLRQVCDYICPANYKPELDDKDVNLVFQAADHPGTLLDQPVTLKMTETQHIKRRQFAFVGSQRGRFSLPVGGVAFNSLHGINSTFGVTDMLALAALIKSRGSRTEGSFVRGDFAVTLAYAQLYLEYREHGVGQQEAYSQGVLDQPPRGDPLPLLPVWLHRPQRRGYGQGLQGR
jgi:hypothetical protein